MSTEGPTRKRRLVSLTGLLHRAWETLRRFPFTLGSAIAAAAVAHYMVERSSDANGTVEHLVPILLTCVLGISLFFTIRMLGEARDWRRGRQAYLALVGLALLTLYYSKFPVRLHNADGYRFALLDLAAHLAIAFAPFAAWRASENGFWQYNRLLFLRFITALLYSGVLYIGLALALAACDALLGLDVTEQVYLELFIWIAFAYNTWFFLAGIPADVKGLEHTTDYPTGLRIFTQYVLIPLITVYMLILLVYVAKIIIEWELPKGWVGYPVIGASIAGMLSLLLIHPLRSSEQYAWIARFSRLFYWALFPLIGLMVVAIWTRISAYGITEKRYLVVVATAWLLVMALLYTVRRSASIRIIPVSLCAVTLLSAIGPWSATAVSRRSQLSRLREQLVTSQIMQEGLISESHAGVPFEQRKEISSIVQYLYDVHGLEVIRRWWPEGEPLADPLTPRLAMSAMGLEYLARWERADVFEYRAAAPNPIPVEGFDYIFEIRAAREGSTRLAAPFDGLTLWLQGTTIELRAEADPAASVAVDLSPILRGLIEERGPGRRHDGDPIQLSAESERLRLKIYLINVALNWEADSLDIQRLAGTALVDIR